MSRYEEFEAFVRTVDAGSFTEAARQLGVAKSAISRRISDLEARLGGQLLIRSTRNMHLTDTGQALYERAVRLLQDWDEAEGLVGAQTQALSGHIRIAAPLSFGISHLGPVLLAFMETHPDVSLDIDFSDRKVDLISEGVDVAIRIGALSDSGLKARKLSTVQMVVVISPEFAKQYGRPTTVEALRVLPELRFGYRERSRWPFTDPNGVAGTLEMTSRLQATNGQFLRDAARAGHGVAILPRFIAHDDLERGRLISVLEDHTWPQLAAYAVYPPTRQLSIRVRALIDYLVDHCGPSAAYWGLS